MKILPNKKYAKNLKKLRKMNKLTQGQLASKVGLTFQQIQKYESGKNRMSLDIAVKICKVLNESIVRLICH